MWQPESTARVCHFDVESSTFKGKFGTLIWPSGTLMLPFNTLFFLFFAKISFRPRIVLSRLFVAKSSLKSVVVFVSVPERLAGSLPDRWSSSLL